MSLKSVVVVFVIIQLVEKNAAYTVDRKFNNSKCQDVCIASGGKAEFDPETKLCKCALTKNIDDTDLALLKKNAKLVEKQLEFVEPKSTVLIKREIKSESELERVGTTLEADIQVQEVTTTPPQTPSIEKAENTNHEGIVGHANPMEQKEVDPNGGSIVEQATSMGQKEEDPNPEGAVGLATPMGQKEEDPNPEGAVGQATPMGQKDDQNPEGIVGQANPMGRLNRQRLVAQRHHQTRPITADQQRLIVLQMRDHLNRLSQAIEQRARQLEIDALRTNLRQLTHTVLIQTPQQRSRMRNIVEETKRRRERQRTNSRLVGAPAPSTSEGADTREKEVEIALKEIFHGNTTQKPHFEIITQDPSLIDE